MPVINNSGTINNTLDSIQTLSINNLGTINVLSANARIPATLELADSLAGTAGIINISQFGVLRVDSAASGNMISFGDATGVLAIEQLSSFSSTMTIDGLQTGDYISIPALPAGFKETYSPATGTLTIKDAAGTTNLGALVFGGTLPSAAVVQNAVVSQVPCFHVGTRIATSRGDVPVENLSVGDQVRLARGGTAPIIWLGHRRIDCRRHRRPPDILPVRVRQHAFGPGRPARDLLLSPDHAVLADADAAVGAQAVLIPVRYLINGATIVQERVASVTYHHVELSHHDVLLAEGLPCESYLDTGNRSGFANGGSTLMMHADFARGIWASRACAELALEGSRVATVRRELVAQAQTLGHVATTDSDLRILANGRALTPEFDGLTWRMRLPPLGRSVQLRSRRWVPAEMRDDSDDTRRLGVAISDLKLNGVPVRLHDPRLSVGWRNPETPSSDWRWTDGNATILTSGYRELSFSLNQVGLYWKSHRHSQATEGLRVA